MRRHVKEAHQNIFCAYLITNLINEKQYIGITTQPPKARWSAHKRGAVNGSGFYLHNAITKYGKENFTFGVIAVAQNWQDLCETERVLIAQYKTLKPNGYNLTRGGEGTLGYKWLPEPRARLSKSHKGMKKPWSGDLRRGKKLTAEHLANLHAAQAKPEWRAKQSASHTGKRWSLESRAKASASHTGKKQSPESIAKTRAANLGRKLPPDHPVRARLREMNKTPEHRTKLSAAKLGKPMSAEARAKMRARFTPELRAKLRAHRLGKKASEETRAKLREAAARRRASGLPWNSPEQIAKLIERNKNRKGTKLSDEQRETKTRCPCSPSLE